MPVNDHGSRVIVTTRFEAVARASLVDHQYFCKMELLSKEDAKNLFEKSLYESRVTESSNPHHIDEIPDRVWEMCGGMPLPIVTMSGLVASETYTDGKEWIQVCESLFPKPQVCHKPEEFMRIINYCYSVLPSDLKTCSMYLCIFPKGSKISRKRLIRRWIAEGFVSEKQGLSEEDVAEACFNQLLERRIIRPVEHSSDGRVKSCQVHDMVLEHIISKAGEENFVTVVGGPWSMPAYSNKVRRLSLQSTGSKHAKEADRMNLSHVRSLTVFGSLEHLHFKSFKTGIVQVLDLEGCGGFEENHVSVSDICKMTLLKYLSLRRTDVRKLPSNIGDLKYLETLDVRETKVQELPPSAGRLERISSILGGNKRTREALKLPKEIKKGTVKTLRTLSGIEIVEGSVAPSDLNYFTGLRKLAIYKLHKSDQMFKDLLSSIQYLSGYYLQTLVIDDESSGFINRLDSMSSRPTDLRSLELSGRLLKLPNWLPSLKKLIKLTLSATALRTDHLVLLSELDSLFSLTFSVSAKQDPTMAAILEKNKSDSNGEIFIPAGGFSKLKLLRISVPLLPPLNFAKRATPELERLELSFKKLEGLYGMDELGSLHDLILTVDGKAGIGTKSVLDGLKKNGSSSKRKYALIVNEYHDSVME